MPGERNSEVLKMKKDLVKIGFGSHWKNPTTYYGPDTEKVVRDFQKYYGLAVDGVMGDKSLLKLEETLSSPYQRGNRSEAIKSIKQDLVKLGFGSHWTNPTTYYGADTEKVVREFQKKFVLPVSGIVDEITLAKIEELYAKRKNVTYKNYDVTLQEALDVQMDQLQQTDKYRNDPAYVSSEYIEITRQGVISSSGNVNLRTSPTLKNNNNVIVSIPNGTKIKILDEVNGDTHAGSKKWYKIEYNGETLY